MIYSVLQKIKSRVDTLLGFNSAHIPRKLIKNITKNLDEPLVIDVGCNVGEFSQIIFDYNRKAHVLAFDIAKNLEGILYFKFSNYNFEYFRVGVSNSSGFQFTHSRKKYDRKSFLTKSGLYSDRVKVIKLDDILEKTGKRSVQILKIDTEGNDFKVLEGAQKLLLKTEVIIFELMYRSLVNGKTPQDYLSFLKSKGFKYFYRSTKFFGLIEIQIIQPWEIMTQNIVCSRVSIYKSKFLL